MRYATYSTVRYSTQHFNEQIFQLEQKEYELEKIDVAHVTCQYAIHHILPHLSIRPLGSTYLLVIVLGRV